MGISDWVLVCSVIVALVLGIRSLRQTKDLRRKEYRNKLIDEIIDWASDIANTTCRFEPKTGTKEDLAQYLTFNTKSEYVKEVAKTFGDKLVSSVDDVIFCIRIGSRLVFDLLQLRGIERQLMEINPWLESDDYVSKTLETLPQVKYKLRMSAIKLMQEAAQIKSENT